jgi:hypothetical protein
MPTWREHHRKDSNGFQVDRVAPLAMRHKPRVDFLRIFGSARGRCRQSRPLKQIKNQATANLVGAYRFNEFGHETSRLYICVVTLDY